jgi:hypothetical protein
MSDYTDTNLRLMVGALSPAFDGTPQEFLAELVRLSTIVSPNGVYYVIISDTAPTSNQGIWLKDGTKPYVWDTGTAAYIPADLTDSLTSILAAITALQAKVGGGRVIFSATEPAAADRPNTVWIETASGKPIALRYWDGVVWAFMPDRFPSITTTGTANAQVATFGVTGITLASLENKILYITPVATNTGAVTLAVDGTAATQIRVGSTALSAGQFEAGREHQVVYDGVYYRLLNPSLPNVGTAGTYNNVQSITTDAQGRVTTVSAAGSSAASTRAFVTFDSSGAAALAASTITDVRAVDSAVKIAGHGFSSGQLFWCASSITASIAELAEDIPYYFKVVDVDWLQIYKSKAAAIAGAGGPDFVTLATNASGLSNAIKRWAANPILASAGIDGVILEEGGSWWIVDFTTDQPNDDYAISGTVTTVAPTAFCYLAPPAPADGTPAVARFPVGANMPSIGWRVDSTRVSIIVTGTN